MLISEMAAGKNTSAHRVESDPSERIFLVPTVKSSLLGIILIVFSVLVFGPMSIFVIQLEQDGVPFLQVTFIRNFIVLLFTGQIIAFRKTQGRSMSFFGPRTACANLVARAVLYYGLVNC